MRIDPSPQQAGRAPVAAVLLVLSLSPALVLASCMDGGGDAAASGEPVVRGICGPVDPAAGFTARDSGGVRIAENLAPATAEGAGLRVGLEPLAVIGARESDPEDPIGRLASTVLLADGRVVLADGLSREIRVHGADGAFLHRFGGSGDGPGEFSGTVMLHRGADDTLIVAHQGNLRYARMLPDGTYLDGGFVTFAPREAPVYHGLLGVFGNGHFLVQDRRLASGGSEPRTEVVRLEWTVRRLDPATRQLDSLGVLPREDYYTVAHEGEFEGWITFGDVPFGRVESWAAGPEDLFVGAGDHFQVERRARGPDPHMLIRVCEEPRPLDPGNLRREVEERLAAYEGDSARRERIALEAVPLPAVEPAHLEMRVDAAGRLWVREFAPSWEDQRWRIFGEDGRWLTSVTLPVGLRVLQIGEDRLLAAAESELGIQTVRVYPLQQ